MHSSKSPSFHMTLRHSDVAASVVSKSNSGRLRDSRALFDSIRVPRSAAATTSECLLDAGRARLLAASGHCATRLQTTSRSRRIARSERAHRPHTGSSTAAKPLSIARRLAAGEQCSVLARSLSVLDKRASGPPRELFCAAAAPHPSSVGPRPSMHNVACSSSMSCRRVKTIP